MSDNIIGKRFTRLLVVAEVPKTGHERRFLCKCDCGKESFVAMSKLKTGKTKSCGCFKRDVATKHGHTWTNGERNETQVYKAWHGMKQRCYNANHPNYHCYGGRGIIVCERWLESFEFFLEDMGNAPSGTSIDRIDNSGNYEPGNCRWATRKEQAENTRRNVLMAYLGRTQLLSQWAHELGIKQNTIVYRLRRGWSHEKALSEPVGEWHR